MAGVSPNPQPGGWTITRAEELLLSLAGVISARVVAKPGGDVEEIHLLTTDEISAKQTVRNVESALLAHLDLTVDHRKISVAQSSGARALAPVRDEPQIVGVVPSAEAAQYQGQPRILFIGLQVESQRNHQVRFQVELEWMGESFRGDAVGADVARSRMETAANAALRAVEAIAASEEAPGLTLALDGVKVVDAFDRRYALVAVNAFKGRQVTALAGAALVEDSPDKTVILATLQATDRWVRGHA